MVNSSLLMTSEVLALKPEQGTCSPLDTATRKSSRGCIFRLRRGAASSDRKLCVEPELIWAVSSWPPMRALTCMVAHVRTPVSSWSKISDTVIGCRRMYQRLGHVVVSGLNDAIPDEEEQLLAIVIAREFFFTIVAKTKVTTIPLSRKPSRTRKCSAPGLGMKTG